MSPTKSLATTTAPLAARLTPGRRDRTRQALLRAGESLLAGSAVEAVTIDDIVAAANVAKGTFYNHFPDKESLQREVLEAIRFDITQSIAKYNVDIDDAARRLARAVCVLLLYSFSHRQRAQFLVRTLLSFQGPMDKANQGVLELISSGLSSGRLLVPTAESGVLLVVGIAQVALARSLQDGEALAGVARAQHLIAMMLRGLGLAAAEADMIAAQEADHIIRSSATVLT